MEQINLRKFKKHSLKNQRQFRHFLTRVENNPPKDLDKISVELDREVWAETDCLSCANCCKTMTPTFKIQDLKRISAHFNMKISEFKKKWLYFDKDENDWMNRSKPCQFLDLTTNMCSIYEIRPGDCAGFPHLTRKPMKDYMHLHRQNIQYCPATFKWVEKLQQRILLSKMKIGKIELRVGE